MNNSFYQYTLKDLEVIFAQNNLPPTGPGNLFNWHYKKRIQTPCHKDLAKISIDYLQNNMNFDLPKINTTKLSIDKTVKFLFALRDDSKIETVLIPFNGKYTICLSSQVGCAMKCSFCYTGLQGLKRQLSTDEIVGQFLMAQNWLTENRPQDDKIQNIVFMGQGEPLHNFDAVKKACEIFLSQHGLSIAFHKITVSTAGYLPGIQRWAQEMPNINLALSLHSAINQKRDQLIPLNKTYPLEKIIPAIDLIKLDKKRFITYEYLLVKDFNDSEVDAKAVGELLRGKEAYINLIPFNPFPEAKYQTPEHSTVVNFKAVLDTFKIPTLIRATKGDEIYAACGQLNTKQPHQ